MIDEACLYMEDAVTDKKGVVDWGRLHKPNQSMMEHIKEEQKKFNKGR